MPIQFRYTPPKPVKRHTVTPTAGGVAIQQAPAIYVGDSIIGWTLQAATEAQKDLLKAYYDDASSPDLTFIGHNEPSVTYVVKAFVIDEIRPDKGLWYLSGSFQVISSS